MNVSGHRISHPPAAFHIPDLYRIHEVAVFIWQPVTTGRPSDLWSRRFWQSYEYGSDEMILADEHF